MVGWNLDIEDGLIILLNSLGSTSDWPHFLSKLFCSIPENLALYVRAILWDEWMEAWSNTSMNPLWIGVYRDFCAALESDKYMANRALRRLSAHKWFGQLSSSSPGTGEVALDCLLGDNDKVSEHQSLKLVHMSSMFDVSLKSWQNLFDHSVALILISSRSTFFHYIILRLSGLRLAILMLVMKIASWSLMPGLTPVVTLLLGFFCRWRGLCHRTESNLFPFVCLRKMSGW